jgi:hypothetical protein
MPRYLMPIDNSLVVIDGEISPIRKGLLLIKDCWGYITYHAILREPFSEINLCHIKSGIYEIELIIGQTSNCQDILIK